MKYSEKERALKEGKKVEEVFNSPDEFAEFVKHKWSEEESRAREKFEELIERRAERKAAEILRHESEVLKRRAKTTPF